MKKASKKDMMNLKKMYSDSNIIKVKVKKRMVIIGDNKFKVKINNEGQYKLEEKE